MQRFFSVLVGISLIVLGLLALAGNWLLASLNIHLAWWDVWRLWPLAVVGVGAGLLLLGFTSLQRRGMGALFIPALPILTTGGLLLFASLFDAWWIWRFSWSLIIVSVALGFLAAAFFSRNAWLGIPAILVGLNGVALAFCSFSGLWQSWAALWSIEPLGVGLVLLLIAIKTRSATLALIGFCFCGFAGVAFSAMTGLLIFGDWVIRLAGPALLIVLGGLLLIWGLMRHPALSAAVE